MRTNIEIDDALLAEAMQVLGSKTKKAAVQEALERAVRDARRRRAFAEMEGLGWEGDLEEMRRGVEPVADR